jgi:hypothetical protein
MDMAHGARVWTRGDVLELPDDGKRYELVDGALLVTPSPSAPWAGYGIPTLVVEVLSPSTARYDRITKRRRYQRSGVERYWIVTIDLPACFHAVGGS